MVKDQLLSKWEETQGGIFLPPFIHWNMESMQSWPLWPLYLTSPDLPEVTPYYSLGCPCSMKWFSNSECPRKQVIVIRKLGASHNPSLGSQALEKEQIGGGGNVHEIPTCSHSLCTDSSEVWRNAKDTWNEKPVSRCCERKLSRTAKRQKYKMTFHFLLPSSSCRCHQLSVISYLKRQSFLVVVPNLFIEKKL